MWRALVLLAIFLAAAPAKAVLVHILGYGSNSSNQYLKSALIANGHAVTESEDDAESYSGAALPTGTQVVWVKRYYSSGIPAAGLTALRNFVYNGGGLVLDGTCEMGWPSQWQTIADILPHEGTFDPGQAGGLFLRRNVSDPLLNAGLPNDVPFPVYYSSDQVSFTPKATSSLYYKLIRGSDLLEFGGVIGSPYGRGRVLVCPFINFEKASESADCRRLWGNIVNWAARPRQGFAMLQNTANGGLYTWNLNSNSAVVSTTTVFNTMDSAYSVVGTSDFNGDGQPDIGYRDLATSTFRQVPLAARTVRGTDTPLPQRPSNFRLIGFGDVDKNGTPDAFYVNTQTNRLEVDLLHGLYPVKSAILGTRSDKIIGVGDFNADGYPDVMFQNTSNNSLSYWKLTGTTVVTNVAITTSIGAGRAFVVGDVNGDGRAELLSMVLATRAVQLWYMTNTALFKNILLGTAQPGYEIRGLGFWPD